jgi:hypothetical protein
MDEAFLPFNQMIDKLSSLDAEIYDEHNGIHLFIERFEIDTPVELDIVTDEQGKVHIGIVPPLYRVETSYQPSYHSLRFSAEKYEL